MTSYPDLRDFFSKLDYKFIIAADAETRVHKTVNGEIQSMIPAGGVAIALDPIARASHATYIARGKTPEDKKVVGRNGKLLVGEGDEQYTLKRIFVNDDELNGYYNGTSNQMMWPLCHVTFEQPQFNNEWYEQYVEVNKRFAQAIKEEINGKTFVWIHDYQLALVPKFLGRPKNTVVAMFWHIPWPTWEVFRIVPQKKEILESLLSCDYLAFHRGYQARNFIKTIEREFEARVEEETSRIAVNKFYTTVKNHPLGIDTDVIRSITGEHEQPTLITNIVKNLLGIREEKDEKKSAYDEFFEKNKVMIGVDRLDYTKGLVLRLQAIERFFDKYPKYIGKTTYLGILSPSRETIPSYIQLKKDVIAEAKRINEKLGKENWKPINLIHETFSREEIVNFYNRADICLVTPRDDGMNLVSKEFAISTSFSNNPGMLILSQFAGSAIDLTSALIVNPYDVGEVADAIKRGFEMDVSEKKRRTDQMVETLEDKNVYEWARDFVRGAQLAARENTTAHRENS